MSSDRRGNHAAALTERELKILALLAEGQRLPEIARALGLTVRGFYGIRQLMFAKLGARTDSHAAAIGFRRGLLALDRRACDSR